MRFWTKVWFGEDENFKYTINIDCKTDTGKNVLIKFQHYPSLILTIPKKGHINHVKEYFKKDFKLRPLAYEELDVDNMWTGKKQVVYELYFDSLSKLYKFNTEIDNTTIRGLHYECHELPRNQQPISKFRSKKNIKTHGWIKLEGTIKIIQDCDHYNVIIKCQEKQIIPLEDQDVPPLSILSIDGEMNSSNIKAFPKAYIKGDEMFKLGCVFEDVNGERSYYDLTTIETEPWKLENTDVNIYYYEDKFVDVECRKLSVVDNKIVSDWGIPDIKDWEIIELVDQINHYTDNIFVILKNKSVKILYKDTDEFKSFNGKTYSKLVVHAEKQVIDRFEQLIRDTNPDIIIGHNIMGFDLPYINMRKEEIHNDKWSDISRTGKKKTYLKHSEWKSAAYSVVHTTSFNCPERIIMDTLVIIKRLEKMTMYTLNHISKKILGDSKIDMDYKDMFRIFRLCRFHKDLTADQLIEAIKFNQDKGIDITKKEEAIFFDKYEETLEGNVRGSLGRIDQHYIEEILNKSDDEIHLAMLKIINHEATPEELSKIETEKLLTYFDSFSDNPKSFKDVEAIFDLEGNIDWKNKKHFQLTSAKLFTLYQQKNWNQMFVELYKCIASASVSEYVVKDCVLPIDIFKKMTLHLGYIALANLTNVEFFDTYTRGQGIRVRNHIYKKIREKGYFFESKTVEKEKFKGGKVEDPIKGLHENVFVYDFASLYPSLIRRYNLCFTTELSITDDKYTKDQYHTFEWDAEEVDDKGKPTGNMTKEYHRFLKKDVKEGILPMMMTEGAVERSRLKKTMADYIDLVDSIKEVEELE